MTATEPTATPAELAAAVVHPAPGDLYAGPAGGGAVLVLEPHADVVVAERMSSGLTVRIPASTFRACYRLTVPRRYPWRE